MAQLFAQPYFTSTPLATLTFYQTGTLDLAAIYADDDTPLPNPIRANSAGRFPAIYLSEGVVYRVIVRDFAGVTIADVDPANNASAGALAALAAVGGGSLVGYQSPATASTPRTLGAIANERASLFDFMPASMQAGCAARTNMDDLTTYMQAAIDGSDGYALEVPVGRFHTGALFVRKGQRIRLLGAKATLDAAPGAPVGGSEIFFNGTSGALLTVGAADGNPDSVGFTRGFSMEHVTLSTAFGTGGDDGILVQNTSGVDISNNKIVGFKRRGINLYGGNVDVRIQSNYLLGNATGTAIYLDGYQFGNFAVSVLGKNHGVQWERAAMIAEGQYISFDDNIWEGLTVSGYEFTGSASLGKVRFGNDQVEAQRGQMFSKGDFSGVIRFLEIAPGEYLGSGNASFPNGAFGNLDKTRVLEHSIDTGFVLDAGRNAAVGAASVFAGTSVFDMATTVVDVSPTNRNYQDDLVASLRDKSLIGVGSRFSNTDGATTGGTLPVVKSGGKPVGWTQLGGVNWQLLPGTGDGGLICLPILGAPSDVLSRTITLSALSRARYFLVPFTASGRFNILASIGGGAFTSIFDPGSDLAALTTTFAKFTAPAGTTSIVIKIAQGSATPIVPLELDVLEVGLAEYTDVGTLGSAVALALRRGMKRGAY